MSAAVCGKRAASFFEDQQLLPHAAAASPQPPSKRARFRGGCMPRPFGGRGADPGLVDAMLARFPSASLEFIEKALEECGNNLDSATKFLLNQHIESAECNVALEYQSPVGMSTVTTEGISDDNDTAAPVGSVPYTEGEAPASNSTQWVDILVNEMMTASDTDGAKARASEVLEVFERSIASRIGSEALQSFQKHERQKEHEERSQELQQLKQLVVQHQEKVRSLEVNNYVLSMHLRQAQQGSSIPGHFNRHIF